LHASQDPKTRVKPADETRYNHIVTSGTIANSRSHLIGAGAPVRSMALLVTPPSGARGL